VHFNRIKVVFAMTVFVLAPLVGRVAEASSVALSSVYDATNFPVANVQTQNLRETTRTANTTMPGAVLTVNLGASLPLLATGIAGTNLSGEPQSFAATGEALARCRISPAALSGFVEDAADTLIDSMNIGSGGLTDIDEDPTAPDGTGIQGSNSSTSYIHLGFSPSTMQDGTYKIHCFRIALKADSGTSARLVSAELYENGSLVRDLMDATQFPDGFIVAAGTTDVWVGRFAGDEIGTHANTELKITWEPTEVSLGGPPIIDAVDLAYLAYDSNAVEFDWVEAKPDAVASQLDGTDPAEILLQRPSVTQVFVDGNGDPAHTDAQYLQWILWDPYNAKGYLEIGLAEAGPGIVVNTSDTPMEAPEFFFIDDNTVQHAAVSGRDIFTQGDPPRRGLRLPMKAITESIAANAFASFIGMQSRAIGHFVIPHGMTASVFSLPFWGGRTASRFSLRGIDYLPGKYTGQVEFEERI